MLARGPTFQVPSRSAVTEAAGAADDRAAARRLGVRFVASGSLRLASDGYTVAYQLIDGQDGRVVEREDLPSGTRDPQLAEERLALTLFEHIAAAVRQRWIDHEAAATGDSLDKRLARFEATKPTPANASTWSAIGAELKHAAAGRDIFRTEVDDGLCYGYATLLAQGTGRPEPERRAWAARGLAAGEDSASLRPGHTSPFTCRAEILGQMRRWDEGIAQARHAVEISRFTASSYEALGNLEFGKGDFAQSARDFAELAARTSPGAGPDGDDFADLATADLFAGQLDAAIAQLRDDAVADPKAPYHAFFLAAALELAGRHGEALEQAARYRRLGTDDRVWNGLSVGEGPAFEAAAARVRAALARVGLAPGGG